MSKEKVKVTEKTAMEKLRETLGELYGDEKKLIVLNHFPGVVSIGFGERGDQGGYAIPRSRLPIILTDLYAADTWLKSSDFRRELTKQHLEVITQADADRIWAEAQSHEDYLKRMAGDNRGYSPADVKIMPVDSEVTPMNSEPMVIDEESATLQPLSQDKMAAKYVEYMSDAQTFTPKFPTAPSQVITADTSSRAIAIVESVRRGDMQPLDAIKQIDEDSPLFSNSDLQFIEKNASIKSVGGYAAKILAERLTQ